MGVFSFYNVRKPRQFHHEPIYFDPHKEEMDARKQRIRREMGLEEQAADAEEYKSRIRGTFIDSTNHLKKSQMKGEDAKSRKYKNGKLIIYAVLLVLLLWFLFK
ncbi:MAG: hypothetical protein LBL81_01730 [Tannerella sp.]|jgi:hypothetical protein|nr:hypothetical protein [Tannerella sp.]